MRDIMEKAETDCVYLFDILQGSGGKRVASEAFYHILVLASKDDVKVSQKIPFGDIELVIKE